MSGCIKYGIFLLLAFSCFRSESQNTDSLFAVLKIAKKDNAKVDLLNQISTATKRLNLDTSIYFSREALTLSTKLDYQKGIADARLNYGVGIMDQGKYIEAIQELTKAANYYKDALKSDADQAGMKKLLSKTYNNIGICQDYLGNYPAALNNYFAALKIGEELGDDKRIASSYNNIAVVYYYQKNYALAMKNNLLALKMKGKIGDKHGLGNCYMNIGNVYLAQGNTKKALENYEASMKIWKEIGNMQGVSALYNNMGEILTKEGDLNGALETHFASLKIKEEIGDQEGATSSLTNIGITYLRQNKTKLAKTYFTKAIELAKKIGNKNIIVECYTGFAIVDSINGNMQQSFENYKMQILYRDSLINEENTKKSLQASMEYDYQKKEAVLKEQQEKELAVAEEKSRFQQIIIWSAALGLLLVLTFSGFVVRTLRTTRFQKKLIEEKQREILDSIRYAKRIQKSLLPTETYIERNLKRLRSQSR